MDNENGRFPPKVGKGNRKNGSSVWQKQAIKHLIFLWHHIIVSFAKKNS